MKNITLTQAWSGIADCRTCSLRETALFAGLNEADFSRFHTPIEQNFFYPGDVIFSEGDEARDLFTIRRGLVKLVSLLPDGTQRIVRLLRPGDVGGLGAIVDSSYHHDAIALTETETCRFPAKTVKELSLENPKLYDELMRRWQKALSKADMWLSEFSTGSARQRVARLFLQLSSDEGSEKVALFSREDVGAVLGVTTETASRTVAEFKRQGYVVETEPNKFQCDIPNLKRLLGE